RPDARPVHHPGHRLLPPGAAQQFHPPLDQDPPEVGGLALLEEHIAAVEVDLVAGRDQVVELLVAKPREQEDATKVVNEHQPHPPTAASRPPPGLITAAPITRHRPGVTVRPSPTISIAGFATPARLPTPVRSRLSEFPQVNGQ